MRIAACLPVLLYPPTFCGSIPMHGRLTNRKVEQRNVLGPPDQPGQVEARKADWAHRLRGRVSRAAAHV
jgi:hypothetical protein